MNRTTIKRKADKLFSDYIRSRGKCEWCGRSNGVQLQTAHIFSRRFLITRWLPANAVCLCASCHRKAHDRPPDFVEWIKKHMGVDAYNTLRTTAKTKVDKTIYNNLIERIKAYG